eukprot:1174787-Pyramimonas_sp.AAC.1
MQLLHAAPRRSLSKHMLMGLRSLGIRIEFPNLSILASASQLRVLAKCRAVQPALTRLQETATVYASVFSLLPQYTDRKGIQRFFYRQLKLAIATPLEHCPQSGSVAT